MHSSGGGWRGGWGDGGAVMAFGDSAGEEIVLGAIADFVQGSSLNLSEGARQALLEPAVAHRERIRDELNEHRVDPNEIEEAVRTVLRNAEAHAQEMERSEIDVEAIQFAMRLECRYFPWC